jgi:Uma2 family endonuclease
MTTRGFAHSTVMSRVVYRLEAWSSVQPAPRGVVLCGEARVRLQADPPTFVGVDVAYFDARTLPENRRKARCPDGVPVVAVEILSPTDEQEDVADKIGLYLQAGVPLVWIVDTFFSTVTVHQTDARPKLFNVDQELAAEPFLPGFRVAVADLFEGIEG